MDFSQTLLEEASGTEDTIFVENIDIDFCSDLKQ